MRVLHSGILDSSYGGPAMSTYLTVRGLRDLGIDASVIQYPMKKGDRLRGSNIPVYFSGPVVVPKLNYAPSYKKCIEKLGEMDIYHAQGVWMYHTYALADVARKRHRPYLITPRGMLYPQDIAKSNTWFKNLSLKIRLKRDLNNAACVHVTCEDEMEHCRRLGVTAPIAIIPNPVEIKDYPMKKKDNVFRVGYLGRLSKRKNVESLIYAFDKLKEKLANAELLVIGGDDPAYESFLKEEVKRLGLTNVVFAGFLSGEKKDEALASCSILAMPSEFENLGNVVLEGLVREIPCIATKGSPWKELDDCKCGWWVDFEQDAITRAIENAYDSSLESLAKMGRNGRNLMELRYSVPAVAQKMKMLYDWILGGSKPDFVFG